MVSARELQEEIRQMEKEMTEELEQGQRKGRYFLGDSMPETVKGQILK